MGVGMQSTYDLSVGTKVNMDEAIYMLSPVDTPLLNGVNSDGLAVLPSLPTDQKRVDSMTDGILTPRSTLGATLITAGTTITFPSADERLKFSTGDMIRIKLTGAVTPEIIRITGYSGTADVTVTRDYEGTSSAAQYASGAIVVGLGTALPEGSNPEAARARDRVGLYNLTQIFGPTTVDLSATEQVISKYGVNSEWNHQLRARLQEQAISREQAFIHGRRTDSATTEIRTMGGLEWGITTNVDSTSTALSIATITPLLQSGFNAGGVPTLLMANPAALADINAIEDTGRVRTSFDDARRGRMAVTEIHTEFGVLTVVRNRWMLPHMAFGWNRENLIRRPLRPVTIERLAKTGDSDRTQVVCEESLTIKGEQHMFKMVALTYTGSN